MRGEPHSTRDTLGGDVVQELKRGLVQRKMSLQELWRCGRAMEQVRSTRKTIWCICDLMMLEWRLSGAAAMAERKRVFWT